MALTLPVHKEPWDVNRRLTELGLDAALLTEAIQRGQAARAACTPNHPVSQPGFDAWGETTCSLREQLIPRGWQRANDSNQELVVSPDGAIRVTVAAGDDLTGRPKATPSTKCPKGSRTATAAACNARQICLFPGMETLSPAPPSARHALTYILLVCRDPERREVRAELSCPLYMDEGRVSEWAERIILRPIPLDHRPAFPLPDDHGPQSPEIDIPVVRRP